MAIFSKVFSSAFFTIIIMFLVFVVKLQLPHQVYASYSNTNILLACICLGLIYSVFQALFFVLLNQFYAVNIRLTTMIIFMGNMLSALVMYKFLDVT